MKILSLDWGKRKIGLAISRGKLADPLVVIKYQDEKALIDRLCHLILKHKSEKIIIGVSEGESAKQAKKFGKRLGVAVNLPVEYVDETLTSKEAVSMAIEAGIPRDRRAKMEDAFAAAIILQRYLDK